MADTKYEVLHELDNTINQLLETKHNLDTAKTEKSKSHEIPTNKHTERNKSPTEFIEPHHLQPIPWDEKTPDNLLKEIYEINMLRSHEKQNHDKAMLKTQNHLDDSQKEITELKAKLSELTETLYKFQTAQTAWHKTEQELESQLQILSTQKTTDDSIITESQLELAEVRDELSAAKDLLKNRDHTIQSYADFRVMHRDCDHKRMIDSNKILRLDQEVTRLTNLLQETETTLNETQHQPLKLAENQDTLEDETPTIDDITDDTDNTDAISIPKPTAEFKNPTDNETPEPNEPTEHSQQEYNQNSNTNRTRDLGRAADFGVKYYISKNYRGSNPIQNYQHRPSTPPINGRTQTPPNRQHTQPKQRHREYSNHHTREDNHHNPNHQNTNQHYNPPEYINLFKTHHERMTKIENLMQMILQLHLPPPQNQTNSDPNQQTHEEDQSNYANGSITRSSSQCSITE